MAEEWLGIQSLHKEVVDHSKFR